MTTLAHKAFKAATITVTAFIITPILCAILAVVLVEYWFNYLFGVSLIELSNHNFLVQVWWVLFALLHTKAAFQWWLLNDIRQSMKRKRR